MQTAILKLQTKGQIMLPKSWRISEVYQAVKDGDVIILKPVVLASDEEVLLAASAIMDKNEDLLKRLAK